MEKQKCLAGELCFGTVPCLGPSDTREILVLILEEAGHCLSGGFCRDLKLMFTSLRENHLPRQRKWICVTQTWVCWEMQRARLGKAVKDDFFKKYCLRVFVRELGREKLGDCGRQLDNAICVISLLMESIKG